MKRISVIIPIYNMEKYIDRVLQSLIYQLDENNDEIIIIDDGSTDSSLKICEKYKSNYLNIRIEKTKNSGPSSARNYGIKISTGEYIIFIDADDYIEDGYIENLIANVKKYPLVICGYNIIKGSEKRGVLYKNKAEVVHKEQSIILYEKELLSTLWNKIYISKIIKENNIKFDNMIYKGEDLIFNLNYIYYMNGDIYVIDKKLYNYEMKESGLNLGAEEKLDNKIYRSNKIYEEFIRISPNKNKRIALNVIHMYSAHIKYYIKYNKIINPIKISQILRECTLNDIFEKIINDDYKKDKQMEILKKKYKNKKLFQMFKLNNKFLKINKKEEII